jgi:hypothetical protein
MEYECGNLTEAKEIYNTLKGQSDIENLIVLEYDLTAQQYHIVEI